MTKKDGTTLIVFLVILVLIAGFLRLYKNVDHKVKEVEPFSFDKTIIRRTNGIYCYKINRPLDNIICERDPLYESGLPQER